MHRYTSFPWTALPHEMQGEIRSRCDTLQRLLLGLTCRRELDASTDKTSTWFGVWFPWYEADCPEGRIVRIALKAASCAVQQGFLSLLSCLHALDEHKLTVLPSNEGIMTAPFLRGDLPMVKYLLDHGHFHKTCEGYYDIRIHSCVMAAAEQGHLAVLQELHERIKIISLDVERAASQPLQWGEMDLLSHAHYTLRRYDSYLPYLQKEFFGDVMKGAVRAKPQSHRRVVHWVVKQVKASGLRLHYYLDLPQLTVERMELYVEVIGYKHLLSEHVDFWEGFLMMKQHDDPVVAWFARRGIVRLGREASRTHMNFMTWDLVRTETSRWNMTGLSATREGPRVELTAKSIITLRPPVTQDPLKSLHLEGAKKKSIQQQQRWAQKRGRK